MKPYQAASGLKGARRWRVIYLPGEDTGLSHCELVDKRGNIVRFASHESAKARADRLNADRVALLGPIKNRNGYGWFMPETSK